jgi:Protein of unknown function (DUF3467)
VKEPNASQNTGEGQYANYFEVGHNGFEFVMNFGQFFADAGEPEFHTRIITGPIYAKRLQALLRESIERYERAFGPIPNWPEG